MYVFTKFCYRSDSKESSGVIIKKGFVKRDDQYHIEQIKRNDSTYKYTENSMRSQKSAIDSIQGKQDQFLILF